MRFMYYRKQFEINRLQFEEKLKDMDIKSDLKDISKENIENIFII